MKTRLLTALESPWATLQALLQRMALLPLLYRLCGWLSPLMRPGRNNMTPGMHKDRRLEWSLAAGTFGFGIWLADGGRAMDSDAYIVLRSWLMESDWAILFIITGAMHLVALGINGRAWWTPFVRATVTAANALIYASFATGFWLMDANSTAVFMYSWACIQALICVYGAMKDVARTWGAFISATE